MPSNQLIGQSVGQVESVIVDYAIDSVLFLDPYSSAYIDESASIDITEAVEKWEKEAFIPLTALNYPPKFQSGRYDYWTQFQIKNVGPDTLNLIFRLQRLDSNFLYQFVDQQLIRRAVFGNRFDLKSIQALNLSVPSRSAIPIYLPPGKTSQFFVKSKDQLYLTDKIKPRIETPLYFLETISKEQFDLILVDGFFLGILFFVMLFSFLQYVQHKDQATLFYAIYVSMIFLLYWGHFDFENYSLKIFHRYSNSFNFIKIPIELTTYLLYAIFVQYFINEKNRYASLSKYIKWSIYIILSYLTISILVSIIELRLAWIIHYFFRIGLAAFTLILLFLLIKIRTRLASYLMLGTLCLITFSLLFPVLFSFTLKDKLLFGKDYTYLFGQLGIVLELLFFSMGLGYKRYLAEQHAIQSEQEKLKLAQLDAFKDRLYTDLTHEFRTPLTVILGLTTHLKKSVAKYHTQGLKMIYRNGQQLLSLINQMLELSKLESGQQKLKMLQADIIPFLAYLTESFSSYAAQKEVQINFKSTLESQLMDYDPDAIQKIFSNLISNALKFTKPGGSITIIIEKSKNPINLKIHISDTGKGIPPEKAEHIFNRFYQYGNEQSSNEVGSGIGLALCKELVEIMDGEISLHSVLDQGSTFSISLPIAQNAPIKENQSLWGPQAEMIEASENKNFVANPFELPSVLLIEDNADVAKYIGLSLQHKYHCLYATNGQEGLDLAFQHIPDLIISDLLMPEMNGFEVCNRLKTDERTNHIPLILLTALNKEESRLKGYAQGADAFLPKPFKEKELLIRIEKLLELRQSLQRKYMEKIKVTATQESKPLKPGNLFLKKLNKMVLDRIDDPDMDAEQIAQALFLSRSQLHRKIKALTGESTNIYLRLIRLNQAKILLATTNKSISEIAFDVGFSSPIYFTQVFKKTFGISPKESRN